MSKSRNLADLLDASGNVNKTALPEASILQVIQNSSSSSASTSSTAYSDVTNLTVTVTPSSTSSKILIHVSGYASYNLVSGVNVNYTHKLARGSSSLNTRILSAQSGAGGLQAKGSLSFTYLDAPASTSAQTYKIEHKISNSSSTGTTSNARIVVMEVAG